MPEIPVSEREYVKIYFRAHNSKVLYQRARYDILSYLGDLGGLMDILILIGWLLTSVFSSKMFIAALIGQAYNVQGYMRDFTQFYLTKQMYKLTSSSDSNDNEAGKADGNGPVRLSFQDESTLQKLE